MGDNLSPSAVLRDGITTVLSWIAAVIGVGGSISSVFVVLLFFFCVCCAVLESVFLVSIG
jgi:uncharacterized BrkB/YihY/UPF0761 family membrane protein